MPNWQPVNDVDFHYTDAAKTKPGIYQRRFKAGNRLDMPQPTWIGGIILYKE